MRRRSWRGGAGAGRVWGADLGEVCLPKVSLKGRPAVLSLRHVRGNSAVEVRWERA